MSLIRPRLPGGKLKVLDCGCGPGFFSIMLGRMGHDVTGIDYSEEMLRKAGDNCRRYGIEGKFVRMDAENLEFEDGTFDLAVSRNVIWNLPHPEKAYEGMMRVLRKGGILCTIDASYSEFRMEDAVNREITAEDLRKNPYLRHRESEEQREIMKEKGAGMKDLPLNSVSRPEWDISVLKYAGAGSVEILFADNFNFHPPENGTLSNPHFFFLWAVKGR